MFSEYFWRIARKSIFYEEILQLNNVTDNELLWETVKADSKIIIYGAGKVGRVFLNQITLSKYCEIIAVCDRKYKEIKDLPVSLISIDDIGMFEYDWIVIAIEDAQIAMDIKKELVEHKIDPLKIVWKDCSVKNDSRR
jgi:glyceraldehyde-3-phosphate dehydrogenase/erythrose-4-phosphate dehydrogenase